MSLQIGLGGSQVKNWFQIFYQLEINYNQHDKSINLML